MLFVISGFLKLIGHRNFYLNFTKLINFNPAKSSLVIFLKMTTTLFSVLEIICGLLLFFYSENIFIFCCAIIIYSIATTVIVYSLRVNKGQQECGCYGSLLTDKVTPSKIILNLVSVCLFVIIIFSPNIQINIFSILAGVSLLSLKFFISHLKNLTVFIR